MDGYKTAQEAADILGVKVWAVHKAIKRHNYPVRWHGNSLAIPDSTIELMKGRKRGRPRKEPARK